MKDLASILTGKRLFDPAGGLRRGSRVGIYGAGVTGRKVLQALRGAGFRVEFFLDQAAEQQREVGGVPVLAPFPNRLKGSGGSVPVILAIFNRDADVVAIARRLRRHGYGPVVSYPDIHAKLVAALGHHFWLGDPAIVPGEAASIRDVDRVWADGRSRRVFRSLVSLYRLRDPRLGPRPSPRDEEYLAPDVTGWPPASPLRLVDCGAYDGDTLDRIRRAGLPVAAAVCFEPDLENFGRLRDRIADWPVAWRRSTTLLPCGVSARTGPAVFLAGLGESSRVAEAGAGTTVTCIALDDALPGFAANLVKLDVEGEEEAALTGMKRLVMEHRPGLAISVYHRPADLWRLPALVNAWGLGYRLFLRCYGFNGFDVVCYAVPSTPSSRGAQ